MQRDVIGLHSDSSQVVPLTTTKVVGPNYSVRKAENVVIGLHSDDSHIIPMMAPRVSRPVRYGESERRLWGGAEYFGG